MWILKQETTSAAETKLQKAKLGNTNRSKSMENKGNITNNSGNEKQRSDREKEQKQKN